MPDAKNVLSEFNQGNLAKAIEQATALVKSSPAEVNFRNLLCELLCFRGELSRVDKQLETISLQQTALAVSVSLFRQLVRGALARQECFQQGRPPELLAEPDELIQKVLQLWLARRENNTADANRLAAEIEAERPTVSGQVNGQPFQNMRDGNDFTSFFFEVLTSTGKYYWIPLHRIESVTFHKPSRPREVLWCRARMIVNNGPDGEVYVPTTYLGSSESDNEAIRTGRSTDWIGDNGDCVQGIGHRILYFDDRDMPLLEVEQIDFNQTK